MGFAGRTYTLEWPAGHPLHGLEATVIAPAYGTYAGLLRMVNDDDVIGADAHDFERDTFAGCLVEWNLDYPKGHHFEGQPVPATVEGVESAPTAELRALIKAWWAETTSVPAPLDDRSTGGVTSPVRSLPMDPPSDHPPS